MIFGTIKQSELDSQILAFDILHMPWFDTSTARGISSWGTDVLMGIGKDCFCLVRFDLQQPEAQRSFGRLRITCILTFLSGSVNVTLSGF